MSSKASAFLLLVLFLTACYPKYDWRETNGQDAPYTVLMPDKPTQLNRSIQLGNQSVVMHMSAAQIDDVNFAVGAIKLPDATQAQQAIPLMKNALLNNIAGTIQRENFSVDNQHKKLFFNLAFDATGSNRAVAGSNAHAIHLSGRLVAYDTWVYQVVVMGPESKIDAVAVETFLGSFRVN